MAFDVFEHCPGGEDKKIKFCCGKSIVGDLGDAADALNAGQRASAIGQLNRLIETKGKRACLLAMKGAAQLQMENFEGLTETTEAFLEAHPQNPVAFAFSAILAAAGGKSDTAIDQLQRALELTGAGMHEITYEAIGIVAQRLLREGNVVAARGHLMLQASVAPEGDRRALDMLYQVHSSPNVPLLLKQDLRLESPPEGVPWWNEGGAALASAEAGAWVEALNAFSALAEAHPAESTISKNIAVLQTWLRNDEAGEAWRTCAAMEGLDLDDAVEAHATGQLLSDRDEETVDRVAQTYPISDTDCMMERLLSEKHVDQMNVDLMGMASDDSPPPKGAFFLLDRAVPPTAVDLKCEDIPTVLGEMFLYGRETDREARIEFLTVKTADFEAKTQALKDLLGELGGTLEKEEPVDEIPAASVALSWQWRMPDDVTMNQRSALIAEQRRRVNLNIWPETPLAELEGKRPSEVAGDPVYRVRLLAEILLLELASEQSMTQIDYNELRAKLGLPERVDIEPNGVDIGEIPLVRLHLLPSERLNDEDLAKAYGRAFVHGAKRALRRTAFAVVDRASLKDEIDQSGAYEALSLTSTDTDEALDFNDKAREAAVSAGQSPARWLFRELDLRVMRGEAEEFARLITTLERNHINEPGVAESLQKLLVQMGMITPDGKLTEAAQQTQAESANVVMAEEPGPTGGGIVMPGSPQPRDEGGEERRIVLPGE